MRAARPKPREPKPEKVALGVGRCIRGRGADEHPVGTKPGCPACEGYAASRKAPAPGAR